ncbi:hypothetical protein WN55_06892 [Dufourea novaeangliae]|uniref:Uncharacterized protein n=1 Tax=Dufourea novaeangliae TaxID=178035 RepID=A0A154PRB1_DUFNO|nr:hypothetical protein WN55_06892 [Dufourea novaeangliae]
MRNERYLHRISQAAAASHRSDQPIATYARKKCGQTYEHPSLESRAKFSIAARLVPAIFILPVSPNGLGEFRLSRISADRKVHYTG